MKLKFMLVPLAVLGLAVGSYADCSKDEILKLIDKGFSKSEIKGICNKSESKPKGLSWVNPSRKTCIGYGGKIEDGGCKAQWSQAKDICSASSARLPTIYELRKVIVDCGGIVNNYKNEKNRYYQSCRKNKGFVASLCNWSSTIVSSNTSNAWGMCFTDGSDIWSRKDETRSVHCVRDGQ